MGVIFSLPSLNETMFSILVANKPLKSIVLGQPRILYFFVFDFFQNTAACFLDFFVMLKKKCMVPGHHRVDLVKFEIRLVFMLLNLNPFKTKFVSLTFSYIPPCFLDRFTLIDKNLMVPGHHVVVCFLLLSL
jgi:hypothetical protein